MTTQLFQRAVRCYGEGRLEQARTLCEQVLDTDPRNVDAVHLLGVIAQSSGQLDLAAELIGQSIRLAPGNPDAHFNLGMTLAEQGKLEAAAAALLRCLELAPRSAEAWQNLGEIYRALGRLEDMRAALEHCLAADPEFAGGYTGLGSTLEELGDIDAAETAYRRAIALAPRHAPAHNNLGGVLLWQARVDEALAAFRTAALLRYDHGAPETQTHQVPGHRIRHDAEQVRHLQARGLLAPEFQEYAQRLADVARRLNRDDTVAYGDGHHPELAPTFNRIVHCAPGERIVGGVLSDELDVATIERTYRSRDPAYIVVDGFLNGPALDGLRRYCLESTVWKKAYRSGYMSARIGHGFESPLLFQVAEDLRKRFPGIFGEHRLRQSWAFKYDSQLNGVGIHADFAAVNINFWITRDAANRDPDSGGLIVWDKASPADWSFNDYNNNEPRIREFLRSSGAKAIRVPHRENRVVIFESTLFHETDRIDFHEGYENRRINVTLLYGKRLETT